MRSVTKIKEGEIPKSFSVIVTVDKFIEYEVLRLAAQFKTAREISKADIAIDRESGKPIRLSQDNISKIINKKENRITLSGLRQHYLAKMKDTAIYNKRIRLDDLEELRQKYLDMLRENQLADAEQRNEFRVLSKGFIEVLNAAREEVEGKSMVFNQLNMNMELDGQSDEDLIQRRDELIAKAERSLLGGVARDNGTPIDAEIEEAK